MTPQTQSPLDDIRIAAPCRAKWERMDVVDETGAVRFCRTCEKNVYNVSLMPRADAEKLILENEGNLCVYFARRADGTILTNNCPVGMRERRQARGIFAIVATLFVVAVPSPMARGFRRITAWSLRTVPVISVLGQTRLGKSVFTWLDTPEPQPVTFGGGAMQMNS